MQISILMSSFGVLTDIEIVQVDGVGREGAQGWRVLERIEYNIYIYIYIYIYIMII